MEEANAVLERGLQIMMKQDGRTRKDDERSASAARRQLACVLSNLVERFGKSTVRAALKRHTCPTPSGDWEPVLVEADQMNRDKEKLWGKSARRRR